VTVTGDVAGEEIDLTNGEAVVVEDVEVRPGGPGDAPGPPAENAGVAGESSPIPSDAARSGYPMPPPVDFVPTTRPSVEEEWRMSSLGPPPKRRRSIWLYILIGILALCILACVGVIAFSQTDTGREWIEQAQTEAARATEAPD